MARLTEEQVKEVVIGFIKQKYPNAHHISFTNMEFKERFFEYWVTTTFKINDVQDKQFFFRIDAGAGRINHNIEEL